MVIGDTFGHVLDAVGLTGAFQLHGLRVPPSAPTFVRARVQTVTQGYLRFQWRPLSFGTGMSLYVCAEVECTHSSLQRNGVKPSHTGALHHSTAGALLSVAPRQSSEDQERSLGT